MYQRRIKPYYPSRFVTATWREVVRVMPPAASKSDAPRVGDRATQGGGRWDTFHPEKNPAFELTIQGGDPERAVLEAMRRMNAVGDAAEQDYRRALRRVHEYSGDAVAALARAGWESIPEEAYLDRWALVQLLTDLMMPATGEVLDRVLSTPLPPERSSDVDHRYSTVGQEVVLRTTAVEGLFRLASAGEEQAVRILVRHVRHEHRSVRVACVLALRELGGDAEESMRTALPEEDHYMLEIRRLSAQDAPQPTAVDLIRSPGEGGPVPPPVF
jgi:hypothetical protein